MELKKTASQYKKMDEMKKTGVEEKIFKKGASEEVIKEKKQAEKIINTPKKEEKDEGIMESFVLKPLAKEKKTAPKKERNLEFQKIHVSEPKKPKILHQEPENRMKELSSIIPLNPSGKQPKTTKKEENLTVMQQLGNITGFFGKGLAKTIGIKTVDKKIFKGLTKKEIKEAKKLASALEVETKKYAKEEIIEALELEGQPQKIIYAVIKILYD
jgi:hypothetical protein